MRLGIVSDLHFGYTRGTKLNAAGVNVREADVYEAGFNALKNLKSRNVDAIIDLGDMAHVPHPKKRALVNLIDLIRYAEVPYVSANGNHTLGRTSSDLLLYDVISRYCSNFTGYTTAGIDPDVQGLFIPYGEEDEIRSALQLHGAEGEYGFIAGHFAASDVPFPGAHIPVAELPTNVPVFLGHYHTRHWTRWANYGASMMVYIGSTERFAWGEAKNPTGVAVYDTKNHRLEFIDHDTRRWIDITVEPDNYLEGSHYEQVEGAIVRVTINAATETYNSVDVVGLRKKLAPAHEYQIRRGQIDAESTRAITDTGSLSLTHSWRTYLQATKLPKGIKKKEVERIGNDALAII